MRTEAWHMPGLCHIRRWHRVRADVLQPRKACCSHRNQPISCRAYGVFADLRSETARSCATMPAGSWLIGMRSVWESGSSGISPGIASATRPEPASRPIGLPKSARLVNSLSVPQIPETMMPASHAAVTPCPLSPMLSRRLIGEFRASSGDHYAARICQSSPILRASGIPSVRSTIALP